ncbi:MAG: hypothetical protein V2J65_37625 [Desulfobacteraceae bacterium]|nr:hypothetical protein [Desulfobacteraceae bacterium]
MKSTVRRTLRLWNSAKTQRPVKKASAIEEFTANSTITTTSIIMVTPSAAWVKGPVARNSLTTGQ